MSSKFLWCGLTLVVCSDLLNFGSPFALVGAVLMVIGAVLLLLDK